MKNNNPINNNEKSKKKNFVLESHQLINSLLKNQKNHDNLKHIKKAASNASEVSFSSSFDNPNSNKIFDISPSKDSIEISSHNNQNDSFSKNLFIQYWNHPLCQNNQKGTINDASIDNNKNNEPQKPKNINYNSSHNNKFNKDTNEINYRNKKSCNSPLRMADVLMLKKRNTINPGNQTNKNNVVESITFSNQNLKKIIFIKPGDSKLKNDESKNEEEIKVRRQNERMGKDNKKEENELIEEKNREKNNKITELKEGYKDFKEKKENKESKEKIENEFKENKRMKRFKENKENKEIKDNKENQEIKEIKEIKENKENKTMKEYKENKDIQRNSDIVKFKKMKYISRTTAEKENTNNEIINLINNNNINNKIIDLKGQRKSPIKNIIENKTNNIPKNPKDNENNNLKSNKKEIGKIIIQTEKINNNNIEAQISPKNEYKNDKYFNNNNGGEERTQIYSIRRRFMNSKNKYNNFTPDIDSRKKNEPKKENNINTYMENSNNLNSKNREKNKGITSYDNIRKEEPFKINIAPINNKENIDINVDQIISNTNINNNNRNEKEKEKDVVIKNFINTEKETRKIYHSPHQKRKSLSPVEVKSNQNEKEKNKTILSDDENLKEKEKEKIKEEEENEKIINRKKFQSESEKEKRMRRAKKFLQKENLNKDNKDNKDDKDNKDNQQKNLEEVKEPKNKNKKGKITERINNNNYNNPSKEKNISTFSMQNLFGLRKENKSNLTKENKNKKDSKKKNIISQQNNLDNENEENIDINDDIKRSQYTEKIKVKKGNKLNKEEELRKNEEEKWKKRKKNIIPRRLKKKKINSRIKNKDINNDENNDGILSERKEQINDLDVNQYRKIKFLEDVQIKEIDTTKPVVQMKISQIFLKITQENNHKNIFLFGFDKKTNNLIKFDLRKKKFIKIKISDIEDLSDSFEKEFNLQNTILYNTLTGLFILTGKNSDLLYYYNSLNETIFKICKFKYPHNQGCLLLDKENARIFALGGKNTVNCEYFNIYSNEIIELPSLNFDRANAAFVLSNNKMFGFFGFSFKKGKYIFNLEYIDINKLDKWDILELNFEFKKDFLPFHLKNISTFIDKKDHSKVIIYGGKQGRNEQIVNNYYYIYDTNKNIFEKIEGLSFNIIKDFKVIINIWKKSELIENEEKKGFFFDKEKHFIELPEEDKLEGYNQNICVIIDSECNIHFLTNNQNNINVYKFMK